MSSRRGLWLRPTATTRTGVETAEVATMTTFRPLGVVTPNGNGATTADATVVGIGAQWADDDDATYASYDGGLVFVGPESAAADLDDATFAAFIGLPVSIVLGYKIANINAGTIGPDDNSGILQIRDATASVRVAWQYIRFGDLVEGWNYSPVITFDPDSSDPTWVFTGTSDELFSATGLIVQVTGPNAGSSLVHAFDVLEVSIDVNVMSIAGQLDNTRVRPYI